jgi:hypothetical protein
MHFEEVSLSEELEQWAHRVAKHVLGDAAEENARKAASTVRRHHDEIVLGRELGDDDPRVALTDARPSTRMDSTCIFDRLS